MHSSGRRGVFRSVFGMAVTILVYLAFAKMAGATLLTVVNHSFEDTIVGDGRIKLEADGWTIVGYGGTWNPRAAQLTVPDGEQAGFANSAMFLQTTGNLIETGQNYELTIAVGRRRADLTFAGILGLYAVDDVTGITTSLQSTVFGEAGALPVGSFLDYSVILTAAKAAFFTGDRIGIYIGAFPKANIKFDDVRLAAIAQIPAPGPLMLLTFGLASIAIARRNRSSQILVKREQSHWQPA